MYKRFKGSKPEVVKAAASILVQAKKNVLDEMLTICDWGDRSKVTKWKKELLPLMDGSYLDIIRKEEIDEEIKERERMRLEKIRLRKEELENIEENFRFQILDLSHRELLPMRPLLECQSKKRYFIDMNGVRHDVKGKGHTHNYGLLESRTRASRTYTDMVSGKEIPYLWKYTYSSLGRGHRIGHLLWFSCDGYMSRWDTKTNSFTNWDRSPFIVIDTNGNILHKSTQNLAYIQLEHPKYRLRITNKEFVVTDEKEVKFTSFQLPSNERFLTIYVYDGGSKISQQMNYSMGKTEKAIFDFTFYDRERIDLVVKEAPGDVKNHILKYLSPFIK